MKQVLNKIGLDAIKQDQVLHGLVAKLLDVAPATMFRILASNDQRLTQFSVLQAIAEHLGVQDINELLEEVEMA